MTCDDFWRARRSETDLVLQFAFDRLPAEQHTELVYVIGRAAVAAVPPHERTRREAVELGARLALPVGGRDPG